MIATAVLGVCLQLAAAPHVPPQFIPTTHFTLAWVHTIEKVRWEEDYVVQMGPTGPILFAPKARVKGSAAGMEPPAEAKLEQGWYVYTPSERHPLQLALTRSEFSPDYQWCDFRGCVSLSALMPRDGGVTRLKACAQSQVE